MHLNAFFDMAICRRYESIASKMHATAERDSFKNKDIDTTFDMKLLFAVAEVSDGYGKSPVAGKCEQGTLVDVSRSVRGAHGFLFRRTVRRTDALPLDALAAVSTLLVVALHHWVVNVTTSP